MTIVQVIVEQESNRRAADEVRQGENPQPTSIVPGFIYPGVTVLVNEPKMGMPILCLGVALEVARGGKVFGMAVETQEGLVSGPQSYRAAAEGAP